MQKSRPDQTPGRLQDRLQGEPTASTAPSRPLVELLKRPQVYLPLMVVLAVLGLAFGLQPSSGDGVTPAGPTPHASPTTQAGARPSTAASPTSQPVSPTPGVARTATAGPTQPAQGQPSPANGGQVAALPSVTSQVAGVQATPTATPDYTRESTQCGSIQESPIALNVTQTILGVSVQATRATIYPIEYFRCILMATGGQEAVALAGSLAKVERAGMTHAVLIDLWFTNSGKDFGEVNLKTATLAAAGQVFSPLATLGGRSDVVISGGQGRNVTLVAALKNTVGTTTGPITVSMDAPLTGGKQNAGKYQLFLPTP